MTRRFVLSCVARAACAAAISVPAPLSGQSVPVRTLANPDAELSEPFTSISSIRELGDGRVIIADNRDKLLQIADARLRTLTKIGREGAGPAEYASIGRLYALNGDVTMMHDFTNSRFLVIGPDGKPTGTRRIEYGPYTENENLLGFDLAGRSYLAVRPPGSREEGGVQAVVRWDPATKKADTLTTITLPSGLRTGARDIGNGMLKMYTNLPFASQDVVAVGHDGNVAIVRVKDYHVEWYFTGTRHALGPATRFESVEVSSAEKHAFLEREIRPGAFTIRAPIGAKAAPIAQGGSGGLPKGAMNPDALDDTGMQWPSRKPPFLAGAARVDGPGRVWVNRTSTHDDRSARYDVFDASGKLSLKVVLPPNTTLVGFGNRTVYLSRADDDELRYLQRYPLP